MLQGIYTVLQNEPIADGVLKMVLRGDTGGLQAPGQFVNILLENKYLRRPISVCDYDSKTLTLIYKVVGGGTGQMAALAPGAELDLLTGLGRGFDPARSGSRPVLLGGGVGAAPLFRLCRELRAAGRDCRAVLGFNTAREAFLAEELRELGVRVTVTTADGSLGIRGFVTDAMPGDATFIYACGPLPMLRAVDRRCAAPGQFSLEARMGCGFGACMGCTCQTRLGPQRVCREGPVFDREDLIW